MLSDPYQRHICYRDRDLHLKIVRSKRKSMAIHVFPEQKPIEIRVPLKCSWLDIDAFIDSRLEWMAKAQQKLARLPAEPEFKSGQVHYLMGQPLQLETVRGSQAVLVDENRIVISCRKPFCEEQVQKVFYDYLKRRSETVFAARLKDCTEAFPLPVEPTGLRVRRMKARWGSCSQNGEICLNTLLLQKSVQTIDLVIVHELCHLVHFHHNAAFYALMDRALPDWRSRESGLIRGTRPLEPGDSPLASS